MLYRGLRHPLAARDRRQFELHLQGQAVDLKQMGRELGVRYVLVGSIRKPGDGAHITAQLIDALSGMHLWSIGSTDTSMTSSICRTALQQNVAAIIEPAVQAAEVPCAFTDRGLISVPMISTFGPLWSSIQ
jgi:TolB-like protein